MQTRVKELREQRHISQITLAVRIGCSQNMISKIEKGESDPKGNVLVKLADFFGVSADYLLGLSEKKYDMENSTRLIRGLGLQQEYVEKYEKLSDKGKETVNILIDRILEMEEYSTRY